jgi:hypothetical protein
MFSGYSFLDPAREFVRRWAVADHPVNLFAVGGGDENRRSGMNVELTVEPITEGGRIPGANGVEGYIMAGEEVGKLFVSKVLLIEQLAGASTGAIKIHQNQFILQCRQGLGSVKSSFIPVNGLANRHRHT